MQTAIHGVRAAFIAAALAMATMCSAQPVPQIGYVYPAGGPQGAKFKFVVGGQTLGSVSNAYASGDGISLEVLEWNRPMPQNQFNELRDQLKQLQDKSQAARRSPSPTNTWTAADAAALDAIKAKILKNPPNRQGNPAIAETVVIEATIATNAAPGQREIRLASPGGLSNPLVFHVGQLPEISSPPAQAFSPDLSAFLKRLGRPDDPVKSERRIVLPATINGQILPGHVDRYRFSARKGQHLVFAVSARELIPYLPDAVPGWFQATLAIYDSKGRELAYNDDYRFHPDPVLNFEIPRDGEYVAEIKDAIYRGREDFVYRLTAGELPFVTGCFPAGGPAGSAFTVALSGWNLPANTLTLERTNEQPGIHWFSSGGRIFNPVRYALDTLPECLEQEPNNTRAQPQTVPPPVLINGRIDKAGDVDVYAFPGRAGEEIIAEVQARRLDSPVDSVLRLTDSGGRQVAFSDDRDDPGSGLTTHHADACLRAVLSTNRTYYLHIGDAQHQGGPEFTYRLRISRPRPDFALRLVPSSINLRPGGTVPLTIYALRKDGFTNAITLKLKQAPDGFSLSGAHIPANQDQVRFTLSAPGAALDRPVRIEIEGWGIVDGRAVFRPAVPAEDRMQAFAYRHLVPAQELLASVQGRGMAKFRVLDSGPVKIPVAGATRVRIGGPSNLTPRFRFELNNPPEGITLRTTKAIPEGAEIELAAERKVKPGLRGNLVVDIIAVSQPSGEQGKKKGPNTRRLAGCLPAIQFETAER